jgi:hypothetical protein
MPLRTFPDRVSCWVSRSAGSERDDAAAVNQRAYGLNDGGSVAGVPCDDGERLLQGAFAKLAWGELARPG